ncbi:surface-adhesin E family protein [Sphingomonas sediminicola]|uniref:surface-adhesin E family protein n=2 Tax=Sphingomonas TaxID=13687 RepID=UPI003B589E1A
METGRDSQMATYLDLDSITNTATGRSGWVRRDLEITAKPTNISRLIALYEWDCGARRYRIMQTTGYFRDGTNGTSATPLDWKFAVPDTSDEHVLDLACKAMPNAR